MGYIIIAFIWGGILKLFEASDGNILIAATAGAIVDLIFFIIFGGLVASPVSSIITIFLLFGYYLIGFYILKKFHGNYLYLVIFILFLLIHFFIF
jgi:hypothetical protein